MKLDKETIWWIWAGFISLTIVGYFIYVIETANHKKGCSYNQDFCISSHTEESTHWQSGFGKQPGYWAKTETSICDDWKTINIDCDCITYHWFWGDYKNFNRSNKFK